MYSFSGTYAVSVPISTFVCMWTIYIYPGSVHIFSCSRIGRPIMGIYKSLTDTWLWKLGLRPCNSFPGNIRFEFSVLCLCSVCGRKIQYILATRGEASSIDRIKGWFSYWLLFYSWFGVAISRALVLLAWFSSLHILFEKNNVTRTTIVPVRWKLNPYFLFAYCWLLASCISTLSLRGNHFHVDSALMQNHFHADSV
jgi:hypothetical protein